jgi:hypothetical protein
VYTYSNEVCACHSADKHLLIAVNNVCAYMLCTTRLLYTDYLQETEVNALLMKKMNFNSEDETVLVKQVFSNALESLADEDRTLPQVNKHIQHIIIILYNI